MEESVEILLRGGQFKQVLENRIMDIRQKYDLKKAEVEILFFLSKSGEGNTSKNIHQHLQMNKGHISQAVDALCKRKYLTALPDTEDRRYVHYEVTDGAKEIIKEMEQAWSEINKAVFEGISREERELLKDIAGKMGKNMEHMLENMKKV